MREIPWWVRMLRMICDPDQDVVWRVVVEAEGLSMAYIGYVKRTGPREYRYFPIDSAPEWVKHRLAVLNMMPQNPNDSVVVGVGRRINYDTFWIVEPGDIDDIDAGGKSQS